MLDVDDDSQRSGIEIKTEEEFLLNYDFNSLCPSFIVESLSTDEFIRYT